MARPTRFERVIFALGGRGYLKGVCSSKIRTIGRSAILVAGATARFTALGPPNIRSRFTALGEPKIFALFSASKVQIISLTVGPDGRWYPRTCSMAVVGTLNVSSEGIRRPSSIENKIWDGEGTLISATMVRKLGAGRGVPEQTRTGRGRRADDFKAVSLQRHFWVRNAPYAIKDLGNPLKSRRMRPPSERTKRMKYETVLKAPYESLR